VITAAVWRRGDQKRLSSKGESFGNRSVPQRRVRFAWECSGDAIALLVERFPRWLRHQHRITETRERREICVALSQIKQLGEQAIVAVAASLACGGPVVRGQLIASHFYEALRHELKQSPVDDTKRAALIAASDRCEHIAAASINPTALLDELRTVIAVLEDDTHPLMSPPTRFALCCSSCVGVITLRAMMQSRNPGANRSICASICLVMSTCDPLGT